MGDIQKPDKKSTKSLILRKVMLQLLKKKKAYTMDTYRNLTKKKNKTNELPINGTHSCYIYILWSFVFSRFNSSQTPAALLLYK